MHIFMVSHNFFLFCSFSFPLSMISLLFAWLCFSEKKKLCFIHNIQCKIDYDPVEWRWIWLSHCPIMRAWICCYFCLFFCSLSVQTWLKLWGFNQAKTWFSTSKFAFFFLNRIHKKYSPNVFRCRFFSRVCYLHTVKAHLPKNQHWNKPFRICALNGCKQCN